ncbi:RagB/SusD family nutrient uptake outer membrane protein [Pedobacter sp. PAMC26386]|nr:RagB/SusD family nutrient uptake outer membrane protein [Pedobacter sp. PAMC26386]
MMKSIQIITKFLTLAFAGSVILVSCKKSVLDRPLDLDVQEATIFANIVYTTDFVTNIYGGLPNGYTYFSSTLNECATDDARNSNQANSSYRFTNGSWGYTANADDIYKATYGSIRNCNVFFENIYLVKVKDHSNDIIINNLKATEQRDRLTGEVFFLRAFYYFELLKRYGGVPLVTKTLTTKDNIDLPKNTFEEITAQISKDCDSAFKRLPATYIGTSDNYYGRATKWSAQALKARTLLYAASPLNNPNRDVTKWNAAANAAKPFFDGTAPFSLPSGISGYESVFKGNTSTNTEVIWSRPEANANYVERANYPVGEFNGGGGVCPSQYLVDTYEMKDGLPITQSPLYDAGRPYDNRDPRFASTILYNGASFKSRTIETFTGGADGPQKQNGTRTGYYMRKHMDLTLDLGANSPGNSQHNWVHFRLAEMLLNYAEALNESNGPTGDVYLAINKIRKRVNMPDLPNGLTQEQMRDRIRNERRIELCFEGHRYWDARRWNIATTVFNRSLKGMKVEKNGTTISYTPYDLDNRIFTANMNRYPFQLSELQANPNLIQNEGWGK